MEPDAEKGRRVGFTITASSAVFFQEGCDHLDSRSQSMENVKVALWGFGAMGSGVARLLLQKQGVEIVSVCGRASNVGRDMYEVLGVDRHGKPPVIIADQPEKAFPAGCADVIVHTTDSFVKNAFEKISFAVERGFNVVSIAEEMAYPRAQHPEKAEEIDRLAKAAKVSVLGTGINPGFVMDLLILALTGTCERVDRISAKRVNDLSPFGRSVMAEQGVGLTMEAFQSRMAQGTITGHVGFPESIRMIADGLGWETERVEQSREEIMTAVDRETPCVRVAAGCVAGCRQKGVGYVDGQRRIELEHPQQIRPELEGVQTGDYIDIEGVPNISLQIQPEIAGGIGTIAMTVNMIPHVINAAPGLKTMLDLPVPRAIMGDMRNLIQRGT
jgi:4-hydroxy-tetrahydrodipicolinate reductase